MNPDLESVGGGFVFPRFSCYEPALPETPDSRILRPESLDSPRRPVTGNWLLEISAQLMGRDAKVAVGEQLTDSNSHSIWRQTVRFQTGQARNKPRSLRPPGN